MAIQFSVFIATSLDGFIARRNGDIDWLDSGEAAADGEDYGYAQFVRTVDCLVMGRKSFEKVMSFDSWSYDGLRVIVLSHTLPSIPAAYADKAELHSGSLDELIEALQADGVQRVYLDGGRTIQHFLRAGLVYDLTITRIPVLLGDGLPLFGALDQDIRLKHIATQTYNNGLVQSSYTVAL